MTMHDSVFYKSIAHDSEDELLAVRVQDGELAVIAYQGDLYVAIPLSVREARRLIAHLTEAIAVAPCSEPAMPGRKPR